MKARILAAAACGAVLVASATPAAAVTRPGRTERISIGMNGGDPNDGSSDVSLSADARFVAFGSLATNLVPGDDNGAYDAFVYDRLTGRTELAAIGFDGSKGLSSSGQPRLTADGRLVAFHSNAPNLVPDDENIAADVFVRDRVTGDIEVVSVASDGTAGNSASFESTISADGRYVAFQSNATNLVPGDTNGEEDLFVHDRASGSTVRVSVADGGAQANDQSFDAVLSADGHHVAFRSWATNLVDGDTNGYSDIFVHDLDTLVTQRVSVTSDGAEATYTSDNPSISADGRYVAFDSQAENLVPADNPPTDFLAAGFGSIDAFVHDRVTGRTERVSVSSSGEEAGGGGGGMISADGRYVVFSGGAFADEDANGASDLYVRDRILGTTERVVLAQDGGEVCCSQWDPAMSPDGRFVGFVTRGAGLVPGDGNNDDDVYLRDRGPAVGIGELDVAPGGDSVRVAGWARLSGTAVDVVDAAGDAGPAASQVGAEIVGATLAHRPEEGDLLATIRVSRIPGIRTYRSVVEFLVASHPGFAGAPGLTYGIEITVGGTVYQLRTVRVAPATEPSETPVFALYRCAASCDEVARLRGGFGTTGEEVQIAVPLSALGATPGQTLTDVRAFIAPGTTITPAAATMDEASLGSVLLHPVSVMIGIASPGTPEVDVEFTPVATEVGRFDQVLATDGLTPGAYDVWARACAGEQCGSERTTIEVN